MQAETMTAKIDYTLSTPGAFRGLYRTVAWGYVTNDNMSFQVPEAEYRAFGYEPAYEKLPWKEDYVGTKHPGK
jgi:hypothetical protein